MTTFDTAGLGREHAALLARDEAWFDTVCHSGHPISEHAWCRAGDEIPVPPLRAECCLCGTRPKGPGGVLCGECRTRLEAR